MRVAAIQMVSTPDVATNLATAAGLPQQAADQGAELAVLPEYFCFMGHADRDKLALAEAPGHGPLQDFLSEAAQQHGLWLAGGTIPLQSGDANRAYNSTLVFNPRGEPVARYDKIHLFAFANGREAYDESTALLRARAIENLAYIAAPAQGGQHINGHHTWGHSLIASPWGEVLAQLDTGKGLILAECDWPTLQQRRQQLPALQHRVLVA